MLEKAGNKPSMPRPLTRAQKLENAAFLRALLRTGNIRLAARETGLAYGTVQHRRRAHPAFAQEVEATLATAQARLGMEGGVRGPERCEPAGEPAHRTKGGEPVVVRRRDGKLQVRRAQPGKLTRQCEQAFLLALSATANVRLSAKAAGADENAFYRRLRGNPAFAREMRLALETGYERLELSLIESTVGIACEDDAWRHNSPPATPPMTVEQTMQLLHLHQKGVRLQAEPPHLKRRRGESRDAQSYRLACMYQAGLARDREAFRVAEALRNGGPPSPHELPPPVLPDLSQVTGWSRADPAKRAYHEGVALFGGWRVGNLSEEQRERAKRERKEVRRREARWRKELG